MRDNPEFVSGKRQSISIPKSAVLTNNELNAVYRKRNGKAVLTQVRLGKEHKGDVEILAGLRSTSSAQPLPRCLRLSDYY